MSSSASASAAGGRRMPPLSRIVSGNKVASSVAGAVVFIYALWEIRVRAAAKAGRTPRTLTQEWQAAQTKRSYDLEFQSDPYRRVIMNPHRHSIPASQTIHPAS